MMGVSRPIHCEFSHYYPVDSIERLSSTSCTTNCIMCMPSFRISPQSRFGIDRSYDYIAFKCNLERRHETHRFTLNEFYACYDVLHPSDIFSIKFHGDSIHCEHQLAF